MANLAVLGGQPVRSDPWPVYPQAGPDVLAAIERVARSGLYHPDIGTEVTAFEKAFAAYHGAKHAVAVSSGTLSLQMAVAALGIGIGHEVIVPAYTYIATGSCVADQNAIAVFVDAEPRSQGADPDDIARKITPRTRAIVVVHVNGYPCDMDRIMAVAEKHGLPIIEDCSHAHGATHRGRKVGTLGRIGAFSLQHKKILSAGCGGVALTQDDALADRMRALRAFTWSNVRHNWLMSEFHAAIAAAGLSCLDEMNAIRRRNAQAIVDAIGAVEGVTPLPGLPDTVPVHYNLILQYDQRVVGAPRRAFVAALKAEGIPIHMFYVPLQRWPIFAEATNIAGQPVSYRQVSTPVADGICDHVNLEIKVHPTLGEREIRDTASAIRKILEHRAELIEVEQRLQKGNAR